MHSRLVVAGHPCDEGEYFANVSCLLLSPGRKSETNYTRSRRGGGVRFGNEISEVVMKPFFHVAQIQVTATRRLRIRNGCIMDINI
jgi:hypothetical protein